MRQPSRDKRYSPSPALSHFGKGREKWLLSLSMSLTTWRRLERLGLRRGLLCYGEGGGEVRRLTRQLARSRLGRDGRHVCREKSGAKSSPFQYSLFLRNVYFFSLLNLLLSFFLSLSLFLSLLFSSLTFALL